MHIGRKFKIVIWSVLKIRHSFLELHLWIDPIKRVLCTRRFMHKKLCKCRASSIDSPRSSTRWKLGKHNCLHKLRLYLRMTILKRLCWRLSQINYWVRLLLGHVHAPFWSVTSLVCTCAMQLTSHYWTCF